MTITYPLSLPASNSIASVQMRARSVVGQTISPFTGASQVQEHQGQWWEADVVLRTMERADAEPWIAFLGKLKGRKGTFLFGDPNGKTARGLAGGTPLVNGASQTGSSLITDGWDINVNALKAGDYIGLGTGLTSALHKILADGAADGSGNATFDIWPDLKTSPADDETIVIASAVGLWRIVENSVSYAIDESGFYNIVFAARDAL